MENLVTLGLALIVGLVVGVLIGRASSRAGKTASEPVKVDAPKPAWWQKRDALTGTQMQILQFMEVNREANIEKLQEKFSFIPDRELHYRLEQIVLMGFISKTHAAGDVIFILDRAYSATIESDKTVMLSE